MERTRKIPTPITPPPAQSGKHPKLGEGQYRPKHKKPSDADLGSVWFENYGVYSKDKKRAPTSAAADPSFGKSRRQVHDMIDWERNHASASGSSHHGAGPSRHYDGGSSSGAGSSSKDSKDKKDKKHKKGTKDKK